MLWAASLKMERAISKDNDEWDVLIQKMAKTMKKVCGISRSSSKKETWWWNDDVKKALRVKYKIWRKNIC